jgi:MFS family permease
MSQSQSNKGSRHLWMWGLLIAFFFYQFVARVCPSVMADEIQRYFQVDATQFGVLMGIYYAAYAGMQVPNGILLDLYGPRSVATVCCILCAAGCFIFSMADSWFLIKVARAMIGAGSAGAFISTSKFIRLWFDEAKYARIVGITVTFGLMGGMFGGKPVGALKDMVGWHQTFFIIAVIGTAIAALIFLFVRNPHNFKSEHQEEKIFKKAIEKMISEKIYLIGLFGAIMSGPLYGFADAWGVSYFKQALGWDQGMAEYTSTIIYGAMALGGPLIAVLAEHKSQNNRRTIILSGLAMGLSLALILATKPSFAMAVVLLLVLGFFCAYQVLIFDLVTERTPKGLAGTMLGVVNMINMVSGFVFPALVGKLLDIFWDGAMHDGVRVYSETAFNIALSTIVIGLLTGSIGFYFMKAVAKQKK